MATKRPPRLLVQVARGRKYVTVRALPRTPEGRTEALRFERSYIGLGNFTRIKEVV